VSSLNHPSFVLLAVRQSSLSRHFTQRKDAAASRTLRSSFAPGWRVLIKALRRLQSTAVQFSYHFVAAKPSFTPLVSLTALVSFRLTVHQFRRVAERPLTDPIPASLWLGASLGLAANEFASLT